MGVNKNVQLNERGVLLVFSRAPVKAGQGRRSIPSIGAVVQTGIGFFFKKGRENAVGKPRKPRLPQAARI